MNATKNQIGKNCNTRRKKAEATPSAVGRVFKVDETAKRHFRNPERPKEISSYDSASNDFLRISFLPRLKESKDQQTVIVDKKSIANKERDFYRSLNQLAEHYGIDPMSTKEFEYPYNIALSVWDAEKQLQEKIKNWENIRLFKNGNHTYLTSEERCSTGMNLFYIPVIPLYRMLKEKHRKKTGRLLLSVCSYLYRNAYIPYYRQEDSYLYWNYEMLTDWLEQDEEIGENHCSKTELRQAEMIGDIMEQKISNAQNLSFFQKRLKSFKCKDDLDQKCHQIAEKAIELYRDYPNESIFRNAHFGNAVKRNHLDEDNHYEDDKTISMDKYISFFADDRGVIYQNLIDSVNNEFNEYGEVQEPMIVKTFDENNETQGDLDFENRLFDVLTQLAGVLTQYSRM